MPRCQKLFPNLYSAELFYGKIDLQVGHGFSCVFLVRHTNDKEYIKDQAMQLRHLTKMLFMRLWLLKRGSIGFDRIRR